MNLAKTLRVSQAPSIAFVGAGGKTTAMFRLARELPPPVIVSASSHLGVWQIPLADQHIIANGLEDLNFVNEKPNGVWLVTGPIQENRTQPLDSPILEWLHAKCQKRSIPLLIEADGSRQKPLKAPAEHEPPIPEFVNTVVQVAGLSGLGKPLTERFVHRSEIFMRLSGLKISETISIEALAHVMLHPDGGLKNIPANARRVALLNQADTHELQASAGKLAQMLLPTYDSVLIASLEQNEVYAAHEQTAGIVLAAGGSKRFGQTKQLLSWRGQPFVRVIARTALEAGLSPVIVVTGADAEAVEKAVEDLPVKIVRNENWEEGQASSIRAGITGLEFPLPQYVGSAIFLLADQPQVTTAVIRALVENHAAELQPILAPMVIDQRANPILFDRETFADLLQLQGDVGGRGIFSKHRVDYLPWHDDALLLDVDKPEDYPRLKEELE